LPNCFQSLASKAALVAAVALLSVGPTQGQLPDLGGGEDFPISTERKIGDRIARDIYKDPDYLDDPVLVDYLDGIWQPLLSAARARGDLSPELEGRFAWKLFLARDPSVNAFALPGGYLGIHTGLIALTAHRAEIAGVLGHELAHVTQRHLARGFAQQSRQQPWIIAAMILGAAAMTKNPELANAAIVGSQAAAIQGQLNFSRDMEREADRVGYTILTSAGFSGSGMSSMFQRMDHASRLNDNGQFPYLRTHPLTGERIADAQSRSTNEGNAAQLTDDPLNRMLSYRARILSAPTVDLLRTVSGEPQTPEFPSWPVSRRIASLYGACLASHKLHDHALAQRQCGQLHPLVQAHSTDRSTHSAVALLLLEVQLREPGTPPSSQLAQTLKTHGQALMQAQLLDTPRPVVMLWAQAQIQLNQPAQATQALSTWVSAHPHDAQAWRLLALAADMQGQVLASVRASAEAQAAEMDYAGAMERLRAAQKLPSANQASHFEQSIIQSRLSTIVQQHRHQLDDEKSIK
jgi:predicted Zn-dependent protease